MDETELQKEWLINSALVAFVGALLVFQSGQISKDSINLFGLATLNASWSPCFYVSVAGLLGVASLVFLLAYWIPSLRMRVIKVSPFASPTLGFLLFAALFVGLPTTIIELNLPPLISIILVVIFGLLILSVGIRAVAQYIRLFKDKS